VSVLHLKTLKKVISLINENENISPETNLLENVDSLRRILEIPGIKENPDAEDVQ